MFDWDMLVPLTIGIVVLGVPIMTLMDVRREKKAVQEAKDLPLGDGVTLGEGVRAYCGEDGIWLTDEDRVLIDTSGPGPAIRARTERVDGKLVMAELILYGSDGRRLSEAETADFSRAMIQAAKQREASDKA